MKVNPPSVLNVIADVVLAYKPKGKVKKRHKKRRAKPDAKREST